MANPLNLESGELDKVRAEAAKLIRDSMRCGGHDVRAPYSDALAAALGEQAACTKSTSSGLWFAGPTGAEFGPHLSANLPAWNVTLAGTVE